MLPRSKLDYVKQLSRNGWNKCYGDRWTDNMHSEIVETVKRFAYADGNNHPTVLEIGTGSGSDIIHLYETMGMEVCGLDYAPNALRLIHERSPDMQLCEADARHLPFPDESFDIVFSQGLVEHYLDDKLDQLMREQIRVAERYVIIDVPNFWALYYTLKKHLLIAFDHGWDFGWETEYTEHELEQLGSRYGLTPICSYSWGYDGLTRRINKLLHFFRLGLEILEEDYGKYFQMSIGVVFQKS